MKLFVVFAFFLFQVAYSQPVQPFFSGSADQSSFQSLNTNESALREMEITTPDGKKNVAAATALSLLLPGLGEWYVGDYSTGKYFTIAEGALWLTWSSFRMYGDWVKNDARGYAVQHAGVSMENKDDQYFSDIGNFINIDAYNEQMLRDRDETNIYNPNSNYRWEWDTDANREQYRQLRVSSDKAYNNANFVIAAVVVNHVVSAINAARTAVKHNNSLEQSQGLNLQAIPMGPISAPNGIMLSATYQF